MDNYLILAKREALKELVAEIEAMYYRYFSEHPKLDSSRVSTDPVTKKYWRVVEIDNSLIGRFWSDSELAKIAEELKAMHSEIKGLLC